MEHEHMSVVNEEIDAIAKVLCKYYKTSACSLCAVINCHVRLHAEWIYSEGYRLKSEVVKCMIEEIKKFARAPLPECKTVYVLRQEDLEMLLKKFVEE